MSRGRDLGTVTGELLGHLRRALGHGVDYVRPPQRLYGGFDTVIYGFCVMGDDGSRRSLVARCFPDAEGGEARVANEAAVQRAVGDQQYPCPAVVLADPEITVDGAHFFVMERVPGRAVLDYIVPPTLFAWRLPLLMARHHVMLHALDPAPLRATLEALGRTNTVLQDACNYIAETAVQDDPAVRQVLAWLDSHRPPETPPVIIHGDFHPINMLADGGAITGIIDWSGASLGPAEFDVAMSTMTMVHGPVDIPRLVRPLFSAARRLLTWRYLRAYRSSRPLDMVQLRYYEALCVFLFYIEGCQARLDPPEEVNAWAVPGVLESAARTLRLRTGVGLAVPSIPR